jgi:hypothetical protein
VGRKKKGVSRRPAQPYESSIHPRYGRRIRQRVLRAEHVEADVWEFVSGLLKDPWRLRAGYERMIENERNARRGVPEKEERVWAEKVAECVRLRTAYQDQQAAGLMILKELASKLGELDEIRRHAERELAALKDQQERVAELEADRDALLEYVGTAIPEALDSLTGEERNRVYRMLRLEVKPTPEGYEITGVFLQKGMDALIVSPRKVVEQARTRNHRSSSSATTNLENV